MRHSRELLIPTSLRLENFLSYRGTHKITIPRGVTAIQGVDHDTSPAGSNGAGKTSIMFAVSWALTGTIPTPGFVQADVVNWWEEAARVKLVLEGRDERLVVDRQWRSRRTHLKVTVNRKEFSGDVPEVQRQLDEFLGLDTKLFFSSVLMRRKGKFPSFYDATPTERMKILGTVLDDSVFVEAGKKLSAECTQLDRSMMLKRGEQNVTEGAITKAQRELEVLRQNMTHEGERIRLAQIQATQDADALEHEIVRLQDQIRRGSGVDVNAVQRQLGSVSSRRAELQAEVGSLQYRISGAPTLHAGTCPTCRQELPAGYVESIRADVAKLEQRLAEVTRELRVNQEQYSELSESYRRATSWGQEEAALKSRIEALRVQAYATREGIDNKLMLQYENQANILEHQIETNTVALAKIRQEIVEAEEKIGKMKTVIKGFSKEIRFMLVDEVRELISCYANHALSLLSKSQHRLSFRSESGAVESFVIEPTFDGDRLGLPSDGQAYRFSLATSVGLIRALRHQHPHRLGLIMLDDPVGDLDDNGCRDVGALLSDLSQEFPVVLVSIPRDVGFGDFPKIVVHYRNSRSTLGE